MSDFQNDMNHVVQSFITQITELARRTALNTLESAFTGKAGRSRVAPVAPALLNAGVARAGRPPGGRGAKRTAADLEAMSERFAAFVKANPGLRIEQINKQLGTKTKDLALPIRKLVAAKVVVAKGQKRSTTYFPGKASKR